MFFFPPLVDNFYYNLQYGRIRIRQIIIDQEDPDTQHI